jgi:hypothetical protein
MSRRLGSYLPVSIEVIVWRVTSTAEAKSACDHSRSARKTRNRVFVDPATSRESGRHSRKSVAVPTHRSKRREVRPSLERSANQETTELNLNLVVI